MRVEFLLRDDGISTIVTFDCESVYEVVEPQFENQAMRFPVDAIPNMRGHMNRGGCAATDFIYIADMFGFDAEELR